jgi:hypothetical protein
MLDYWIPGNLLYNKISCGLNANIQMEWVEAGEGGIKPQDEE